jgi:uncharacterized NAD(P)/FAD-binding protein YdhS/trehalose-6-phosphate synthase
MQGVPSERNSTSLAPPTIRAPSHRGPQLVAVIWMWVAAVRPATKKDREEQHLLVTTATRQVTRPRLLSRDKVLPKKVMPRPMTPDFDVAIVGGGFSGCMVAVHLARMAPRTRVLLADKEGAFGRGVAYETGVARHLLNVPAAKMSAFPDEPGHFISWLGSHAPELRHQGIMEIFPQAFLPRRAYGQYVRDVFHAVARSAPGLETASVEIVDIEQVGGLCLLTDNDGKSFSASKVVLALGNFSPGDPPTRDRAFHRSPRYLSSPWFPAMVGQIRPDDDILILGAGLTALDWLLSLDETQHRGAVHLVSRRGLFPQAHRTYEAMPNLFGTREFPPNIIQLLRLVSGEVQAAQEKGLDWRMVIDALRPHTQAIWKSLSLEQRRRFIRHLRPFWEAHRHRVAPSVLAVKDEMIERGQLLCHRARVVGIVETGNGLEVTLFDRSKGRELRLPVSFVVNCTGPECNYYKLRDTLVINLLARGLIHPDPLYLGLVTAANGALLNYLGQPSRSLFTLGSVRRGMLFETTAVPELRVQAKQLAEELLESSRSFSAQSRSSPPVAGEEKIVLISNRGPNDFVWQKDRWVPKPASGGLVSMIDPLARQPNVAWFCCVSEPPAANESRSSLYTTAADQTDPAHHIVPVPLPARIYQDYYGAISNEVIWMLQHHLVGQFGYSSLDATRHHAWTEGYLEANRRMVVAVRASGITPRAFLIQDYHFYPLPSLLRRVFPDTPCLHFTHIPFPDSATLKLIPQSWRDAILNGLLGADVIGMQTWWDARPFLGCCEELLGARVDYQNATVVAPDGRTVRVSVLPASTDPVAVRQTMESPGVASARQRLAPHMNEATIIRVDRLDPSKNQIIGFKAFDRLLEMRPDLRGKARFLAFLIPSRTDLSVYREYRDAVYRTIAEINSRFATQWGFDPIQVFYTNDREQAFAAMEQCDVLLVNSREDGMNLVVKEWAIVSNRPGVAIISETAGVAAELGAHSLLISPLDIEGTAQAMSRALDMPRAERAARLNHLRSNVTGWTAKDWLQAQLRALNITRGAVSSV